MKSASSTSGNALAEDAERNTERSPMVPFFGLFAFADNADMLLMVLGAAGAVANGASQPLMILLFGNVVDTLGRTTNFSTVVHDMSEICLQFVFLAVGSGIASFLQVSCWMATGERQASRIRNLYLKSMLRQEIAFFDKGKDVQELVRRMSGDTLLIQDAVGEKMSKFIHLVSTFLGGFTVAFVQGWRLTLVMISMIPFLVAGGAAMSIVIARTTSHGQKSYAEASVVVDQTIGSIRTVASFTGEEEAVKKYNNSVTRTYKSNVKEGLAAGLGFGTMMLIIFCGYSLGVWYGSVLIQDKGYTGARVVIVIFSILVASSSLGHASPCIFAFAAGRVVAFKIFETIYRKPEIDAYDAKGHKPDDICGDIEFRDVYFSYPSRSDSQIFSGFSLLIPSGLTMALVGESGSGKSTIVSLIERFYDPQAGEILIDGINLKEYQLKWIRGKIGLVTQEPVLFASTIRDNIAYGKDNATVKEIKAAADLANASSFIEKLPQGIDTMVGEHGTQLSGGQKQRVAIARAILKDPRILLLDEATSALDADSERIVQEALDRVMIDRTTIVVAHRLTTVRNATMISVMGRGKILEKGSHAELLMDPNGAYSQLVRSQEMDQDAVRTSRKNQERSDDLDHIGQISNVDTCSYSISLGSTSKSSNHDALSMPFTSKAIDNQESKSKIQESEVSIRRLAHLSRPELLVFILGVIAAIVNGLIFPIYGLFMSYAIETFYQPPPKLQKGSKYWSFMFIMLGVISFLAITARTYFFSIAGSKLIRRIRLMTFEKVVYMEIGWFDDIVNSSGVIGARLSADAAAVRSLVGDALALAVQNLTTLIAGLVIAFSSNWRLSLIILALVPLIGLNFWIQIKLMKGLSADAKMMYEEASQVANDAVGNMRTIASFSAEEKVMELYKMKCEDPIRTGLRQGIISGIGFGVSFILMFCFCATTFYIAAHLLQQGKATFIEFFRVFLGLTMAVVGISESSSLSTDSTKAKSATAAVFAILDQTSKINASDDFGTIIEGLKGDIEFQNVNFTYPTRPDIQIFRDFCLAIQSGKTVALVGESGSGKSTVISLLQRFYGPDSGHILLDGVQIQSLKLRWLRQQMGLVSQEPTLFNDTIRANIAYGKEGKATEAEIISASESANSHNFISTLPQGYDTLVGERGIQLSGGQKQRVAIARAIVRDPKILLLDEATSALDAESEKVVQDALDRVMVNRTTVVVAHRLSTIRGADLIVVVKNGVVIEKGDHETLINIEDGVYASLVNLHSYSLERGTSS